MKPIYACQTALPVIVPEVAVQSFFCKQNDRLRAGGLRDGRGDARQAGAGAMQSTAEGHARSNVDGDAVMRQQRGAHEASWEFLEEVYNVFEDNNVISC